MHWLSRCYSLFGRNLFADLIALLGPFGLIWLCLTAAAAPLCLRRHGRRTAVFWGRVLCFWSVIALTLWHRVWALTEKRLFLPWVHTAVWAVWFLGLGLAVFLWLRTAGFPRMKK